MVEPALTQTLTKLAADLLLHYFRRRKAQPAARQSVEDAIGRHLMETLKWSQRIQFYGMSRAEDTAASTIPLRISVEPRRFSGADPARTILETDLLADDQNYLMLGDPGAGKTTTLKRLVQYLLLEGPRTDADSFQFPVVIRLRELGPKVSISEAIAGAVGIPFEKHVSESTSNIWAAERMLRVVVVDFINTGRVVVIIDGLDEFPGDPQELKQELQWLALNTTGSKIIASSRSGDYRGALEGFDVLELCPLTEEEIVSISGRWLNDPSKFLADLAKVPYFDIADRPLLLCQLLFIYQRYGYLPEQPSEIYRKVVSLLLQEWDAERGISRQTKYGHFTPERKASFLAAIAYELTYRRNTKVFQSEELAEIYLKIHQRFRLPAEQVHAVVSEVETHTGLIAGVSNNRYEFSHLSLQEFLCADHLIRETKPEYLFDYLAKHPAPVAIAIALSSNASRAFAALFLRISEPAPADLRSFLSRLLLEKPYFDVSPTLGVAVLKLCRDFAAQHEIQSVIEQVITTDCVAESVASALEYYDAFPKLESITAGHLLLTRARSLVTGFKTPEFVHLPLPVLEYLVGKGCMRAREFEVAMKTVARRDPIA